MLTSQVKSADHADQENYKTSSSRNWVLADDVRATCNNQLQKLSRNPIK